MSDATVLEVMAAVADQLEQQLGPLVEGLQVVPLLERSPTPPCLDVYPGDPFGEALTFDDGREHLFTIRARVSTADSTAGQELLLGLMDRNGGSVIGAIKADEKLGGTADYALAEGPSGYLTYQDAGGGSNAGSLLGAEWRLRVGI